MANKRADIPPEAVQRWRLGESPTKISRDLGINRNTLISRMERAGIARGVDVDKDSATPNPLYIKDNGDVLSSSPPQTVSESTTPENGGERSDLSREHVQPDPHQVESENLPAPADLLKMLRGHQVTRRQARRALRRLLAADDVTPAQLETLTKVLERLERLDRAGSGLDRATVEGGGGGQAAPTVVVPVIVAPPKAGSDPESWRAAVSETVNQGDERERWERVKAGQGGGSGAGDAGGPGG